MKELKCAILSQSLAEPEEVAQGAGALPVEMLPMTKI